MNDFEGTLVLEKLAEIGKVDEFYDAIDSDDFSKVKKLLKSAGLDSESIAMVLAFQPVNFFTLLLRNF